MSSYYKIERVIFSSIPNNLKDLIVDCKYGHRPHANSIKVRCGDVQIFAMNRPQGSLKKVFSNQEWRENVMAKMKYQTASEKLMTKSLFRTQQEDQTFTGQFHSTLWKIQIFSRKRCKKTKNRISTFGFFLCFSLDKQAVD